MPGGSGCYSHCAIICPKKKTLSGPHFEPSPYPESLLSPWGSEAWTLEERRRTGLAQSTSDRWWVCLVCSAARPVRVRQSRAQLMLARDHSSRHAYHGKPSNSFARQRSMNSDLLFTECRIWAAWAAVLPGPWRVVTCWSYQMPESLKPPRSLVLQ